MVKKFVLDTNILLQYPEAMVSGFEDNDVVICGTVLQELDKKKTAGGDVGYYARESIRILNEVSSQGDVLKGVALNNGGRLIFEPDGVKQELLPQGFDISIPDNRIISTCRDLQLRNSNQKVVLVTNDISMRLNAKACGVQVEEYRNSIVEDSGYKGYIDVDVDKDLINELYSSKRVSIGPSLEGITLLENEFVTLHNGKQSALSVFQNGDLRHIGEQRIGWITPKNAVQAYTMWALKQPADELPLVILIGPAGCGKTFLALAAGLEQTYTSQNRHECDYCKMLISRPVANSFDSVGYLPGSLEEKLQFLYQNFYDNLEVILQGSGKVKEDHSQIQQQIDDMIDDGVLEICGLNFIRGRSLMNTYMVCDETQNASGGGGAGAIRDVISRVSAGSKCVCSGDPSQIDIPTLDKRNCGLAYAAEHMKGDPTTAILVYQEGESVRSRLSKAAIQRMKK